jgi:hypothetical protein
MSTNKEHEKAGVKVPAQDDPVRESMVGLQQREAAPEPVQDVIGVANNTDGMDGEVEGTTIDLPRLDSQVRAHLGRLVRVQYATLVAEPVPERFLTLLEELEREESRN